MPVFSNQLYSKQLSIKRSIPRPTIQRTYRMPISNYRKSFPRSHRLIYIAYGLTIRRPSFEGAAARLNELSHSSHARPAPNPRPTHAGHARRLKRRTEKTIPNETPRPERMSIDERQRSHFSLSRASLSGRVVRGIGATGLGVSSAMAEVLRRSIDRFDHV